MADLRILMLNYEFPPIGGGGAQAHANLLEQFQHQSELSIDVLTSAPKPGFTQKPLSSNITLYQVGLHKRRLHYWRKVEVLEWLFKASVYYRRLIKHNTYDLVHAFFGFPSAWLCYRTAGRLPYLVSLRGSDVPGDNARLQTDYRILAPVFRAIWTRASVLVACSEGLRQRALAFLPDVSIRVIPNGVDLARFTGAVRTLSEPVRLISVGRLSETKRFNLLIETVSVLKSKGLQVRLKIVGDGALHDALSHQIRAQGLDADVELTGRVAADAMPALYRDSDLYVSATMQEGMSNAMLEAMASALPIVTTRCEGVEELIRDNGIVVPESTAHALAEAVTSLVSGPEQYRAMSQNARTHAEHFSWTCAADQYIACYHAMLHKGDANG